MGIPKAIGLNIPNFVKLVLDFVNDVPRVPKCILRWGSTPNYFLMGSQMKLWTLPNTMGALEVIGWDVPKFIKDVPNFVKDVPRVSTCIWRWELAPSHFPKGS